MFGSKTKVCVLGGGIGGLVAAYELSKTAWMRARYEVTVHQMGWRLGGKGASGRNIEPGGHDRIEEHGLHIWLGNYQNAFLLMQDCYDHCYSHALMPYSPFRSWQDAFKERHLITLMEPKNTGWDPWKIQMPSMAGWPGEAEQCISLEQLMARAVELLEGVRQETPNDVPLSDVVSPLTHLDRARAISESLEKKAVKRRPAARTEYDALDRHLTGFRDGYLAGNQARIVQSEVQRRRWILIDLATTLLRGILVDVLIPGHDSLAVVDDMDFRAWLAKHGAEPESIDSAPVRNTYEIVFGYRGGDDAQPDFAAGTAARFLLRWVGTYRGGFIYEMQAGMGDIVFTPLYLTLKDRGVQFRFFHRIQSLHLDAAKANVARIHVTEQVRLTVPSYNPLIDIKGVPSWPATPLYQGQIDSVHAAAIQQLKLDHPGLEPLESAFSPWPGHREFDLELGTDFDKVVLAIPLGALSLHCRELMDANPAFATMVQQVGTVATQSFQLWLNKDAQQLGWSSSEPAILDSYRDSYADFTHLSPRESHPAGTVQNIAYFCKPLADQGPLPDPQPNPQYETGEHQRVKDWSRDQFLNGSDGMRPIWPNAYQPNDGEFRWDYLTDLRPMPAVGQDRFDAQFWCANVNPSDRYVQALTGTTQYRLKAGESGFANVALAGDWIKTGIDAGCIEGATVGGMQAARAISGHPQKISGESDFCGQFGTGCLAAIGAWLLPVFDFFRCMWRCLHGQKVPTPPPFHPVVSPAYVERGGEQVFPQPYAFTGSMMHGFVVPANYQKLKALCDKHLNDPSHQNVEYWPAVNRIVVARLDVDQAQPETPSEYDYGYIREADVSLFIPVVAFRGPIPIGMALFPPYLFVDHPWGILGGREVYGLHKIPSLVTPIPLNSTTLFEVLTYAVQSVGLGLEVPQQRVLSVLSGSPVSPVFAHMLSTASPIGNGPAMQVAPQPDRDWPIRDGREAWNMILKMLFGEEMRIQIKEKQASFLVQDILPFGTLPLVTLKQFRDVANGRFASYQAITQSPARVTGFTGAEILHESLRLRVEKLSSQPLLTEFGWTANEIAIEAAWRMQFSFVVDKGVEVWRA